MTEDPRAKDQSQAEKMAEAAVKDLRGQIERVRAQVRSYRDSLEIMDEDRES
ncbi:hypothetical protein [Phenylobacterium sp.]|jgi:hypothetical protein|uniref:hypothetical protein n=1 Tax=Phenylobacterium sp. TaxID=1871053 RepID=UPI002F91C443